MIDDEKVKAIIYKEDKLRQQSLKYADKVKDTLINSYTDTSVQAEFLAIICNSLDEDYGLGTTLCLDWMLEYYIAREFKNHAYPKMLEIWRYLVEHNHNQNNKLEYFNDCEAFFLDKERMIFVCGKIYKSEPRFLIINEPSYLNHKCYVRNIWRRVKNNCINNVVHPTLKNYQNVKFNMRYNDGKFRIYGDCRDEGHVLTYTDSFDRQKCDHVIWDINTPIRFFFEVNTLWTQITERP